MNTVKKHLYNIIEIGNKDDFPSRFFDIFIVVVIGINLFITLFLTFDSSLPYEPVLKFVENITIFIFAIEYILRIWTAEYLFPKEKRATAIFKFMISFHGIIDLFSFLPHFLPFFFPAGVVAFRIFRVIRIFRLFRINSQYDAFNVITSVIYEKRNQLLSSLAMILIFMIAASLSMYSLEHEAQPEAFKNAFSGIWWSVSTLLTVGYGDIYPITVAGKIMAIIIAFLGVGMVAIPTGIISAGFVENYSEMKSLLLHGEEHPLQFVTSVLEAGHPWIGSKVEDVILPKGLLLVLIIRDEKRILPKNDVVLASEDVIIMGTYNYYDINELELKEITIDKDNKWTGKQVKKLDITNDETIVMIKRYDHSFIPKDNTVVQAGDQIIMYVDHN